MTLGKHGAYGVRWNAGAPMRHKFPFNCHLRGSVRFSPDLTDFHRFIPDLTSSYRFFALNGPKLGPDRYEVRFTDFPVEPAGPIMDDSTSDCQMNHSEVDFEFESNEVSETLRCRLEPFGCILGEVWPLCVVDDQFVPKVGMTFTTLEDAVKFYKDYAKAAERENRNLKYLRPRRQIPQLDIGAWIISKVVLHHSHSCCLTKTEMLKQHRELSMSVRHTIENNEDAGIKPSKTYQSFVAAAGGHRELNFIEKDVMNYITREVRNVSE
ncbi:hypothetical protein Ahy_A03g015950 [Arachis hypogaea]|uniref:FAR1 domain-containing protein n=1 Tax=Arachis hypogaea TaxID=3818 RepID=A0A445E1X5_ARAHY|nr:hypothetical protein Ahy_A03g015950 [Arachis hypogaea]